MDSSVASVVSHSDSYLTIGFFLWLLFALLISVLINISLLKLLLNREQALQRIKYSLTNKVILEFTYELNRDEKIRLLVDENILLKKEIEILKAKKSNLEWSLLLVFILIWLGFAWHKMNEFFTFQKPKEVNKKDEL